MAKKDKQKTIYLVDGSALVYRSHFAFIRNPLINSKGQLVSAIFGFMNSLMSLIAKEKPEYLAVVMDTKEKTFRHKQYPDYKATREKMPDELAAQLPVIDDIVNKLNIPYLKQEGFEADDIIGTLAKRASADGILVKVLTGDKDFAQLVDENVQIINPRDNSVWTPDYVVEKWGVPPEMIIDLLGLMGDTSDNVPGVPGVGPKTALKLIKEHGGIHDIYEKIDDIKNPKLKLKMEENREQAFLSRELVTIKTDMEDVPGVDDIRISSPDIEAVRSIFQEFELFNLMKPLEDVRLVYDDGAAASAPSRKRNYSVVKHIPELIELVETLKSKEMVAFDLETTSLDMFNAEIVGLSFSWEADQAVYVAVNYPNPQEGCFTKDDTQTVLRELRPFWESESIHKTGHNLKFDLSILKSYDIDVSGVRFDSQIAAYLVNPGGRGYGMNDLSVQYLGLDPIHIETLIGKGKDQITMDQVSLDVVSEYAAEDADISFQLYELLAEKIKENELESVLNEIDLPLMPVLLKMERYGTFVDADILEKMSKSLGEELDRLEQAIYEDAGEEFNVASPKQVAEILFEKKGIKPVRKTKTGYSTDVNVLQILAKDHAIPRYMLDYRQVAKLKSTYTDTLPLLIHEKTGRIHTNFNQTIAATGRLSSTNPNFQNIPVRTELGRDIRKAFRPQESGWKIMSADYSQIELRLMAQYSQDERLLEAFKNGEDIHTATAAHVFGTDLFGVTDDMRRRAKVVNFGIMYGAGPFRMSNELEISRSEAAELISNYFNTYPSIRNYIDETLDFARENKYVQTMFGRKRQTPDIDASNRMTREGAERVATNMPIQGTAADIIKLAMIEVHRKMEAEQCKSKMILQVHDELVFEVPDAELDLMKTLVKETMEQAVDLDVPLTVDLGVGENWLEAH
ncbi:MAG: DNA polymerase I [Candidatus Marinimicrobia bacterium]|nr:DNA polymerase I [Candidatus Neomarinimicrobiota bacterium]MCF7851085.1 DNA polymerase I [Candidatus Neomarinimicrobiota bacterium]MCF7905241.1 DNA polymerase I [Candidatus Neomarinimicrobiota bacterium]